MTSDVTVKLAELMVGNDKELPYKLQAQEEKLKSRNCKDRKIGKWLEEFEMPILVEIFNSSDAYFFESFPDMKSFTRTKRQAFAREMQEHSKICQRCSMKVSNDFEWEKAVEKSIADHKQTLKQILQDQQEVSKIEHYMEESINV